MAVNPISFGTGVNQAARTQTEQNEPLQGGKDATNDGDADDGGAPVAAVAPTGGGEGDTLGTRVNTTA